MTLELRAARLPPWRPGDTLRARRLDDMVTEINERGRGVEAPRARGARAGTTAAEIGLFMLVEIYGDYLLCARHNGIAEVGSRSVLVAKPYLLRQTPFDGSSRNGITYTYSGPQARLAGGDENQVIVPTYFLGDLLFATNGVARGTGVTVGATAVAWQDLNVDGRQWAEDP